MRFDIVFAFALLGAVVEALPVTSSNTDTTQPATQKRQLSQTTTTTSTNDVVTTSKNQGTTHDNVGYSWKPKAGNDNNDNILERRQLAKGTGTTQTNQGGYTITTSDSQGTTGDRVGYSWKPEAGGILRRQEGGDRVVREGEYEVTVSKTQGTTRDRTGFSWHRAGLL